MKDAVEMMEQQLSQENIHKANLIAEQEILAVRLAQLRESKNIKQDEVPNFSQTSVSRLEHRKDMKISTLLEYLDSLGMGLEIKTYSKDKSCKEPVEAILLKV